MKKQPFLLALLFVAFGYSANAQSSTSTTTTRQTTVTPAPTTYPATTPSSTTTTESTTTTVDPAATTTVIEKPVRVVPADARIKDKRNKTKIKPKD